MFSWRLYFLDTCVGNYHNKCYFCNAMGKMRSIFRYLSEYRMSPSFFVMLALAFLLWFVTKLGYVYTVELPVTINLEGNKFEVSCIVEGNGRHLMKYKSKRKRNIELEMAELKLSSPDQLGFQSVDQTSLLTALSRRYSDVRVVSVGNTDIFISSQTE